MYRFALLLAGLALLAAAAGVSAATHRGVFSIDFGTLGQNPCATITIKAAGAKGDRATLVVKPPPPIDSPGPCRPV